MPTPKNVQLKRNFIKAREKYLAQLRKATKPTAGKRTLHDTASVLEGLKLQHKFRTAEKKRLEHTISKLGENGKAIDPAFLKRLQKIKKEDKEAQSRFKSIKNYFEEKIKEGE